MGLEPMTPRANRAHLFYSERKLTLCSMSEYAFSQWDIKQLLDEVEHDIVNYQNRGLCYMPKPKAEADNTDTRFW